jgi:hypothetical protein
MSPTSLHDPISDRFARLASQWKSESIHMSNTTQMAMLRSYQRIIGMGPPAIPLILEEPKRHRDHWFWALEMITGENPIPKEAVGKVEEMARAWIEWGVQQGLVSQ